MQEHSTEGLKAAGNASFAAKDYKTACCSYTEALRTCEQGSVRISLLSNRAASYFRLDEFRSSVADCTAVLDVDESHTKAMYRRAQALEALGEYAAAFKDAHRYFDIWLQTPLPLI
jgi:tetratricopeptide (TPR) repeat protein